MTAPAPLLLHPDRVLRGTPLLRAPLKDGLPGQAGDTSGERCRSTTGRLSLRGALVSERPGRGTCWAARTSPPRQRPALMEHIPIESGWLPRARGLDRSG